MIDSATYPELRAWAAGHSDETAAVELLISHGVWLERPDFADFVERDTGLVGQPIAYIDWESLSEVRTQGLPASPSEIAVLDIALSLVTGKEIALGEALLSLDSANTARVVAALVRATQHTDTVTITASDPDQPPTF